MKNHCLRGYHQPRSVTPLPRKSFIQQLHPIHRRQNAQIYPSSFQQNKLEENPNQIEDQTTQEKEIYRKFSFSFDERREEDLPESTASSQQEQEKKENYSNKETVKLAFSSLFLDKINDKKAKDSLFKLINKKNAEQFCIVFNLRQEMVGVYYVDENKRLRRVLGQSRARIAILKEEIVSYSLYRPLSGTFVAGSPEVFDAVFIRNSV